MFANLEATISSVVSLYDVKDDTKVDLLDLNMVKPMIVVTNQDQSDPYDTLEAKVPLDRDSRKYIHVNIVNVKNKYYDGSLQTEEKYHEIE